jgi:hypothetical protein
MPPEYPPHLRPDAPGVSLAEVRASLAFEAATRQHAADEARRKEARK